MAYEAIQGRDYRAVFTESTGKQEVEMMEKQFLQ